MICHPIHHTFAPHVDAAYAWATLKLLFQPWKWQKGKETDELRAALAQHFQAEVTLFASGREALLALLQELRIGKGDEVIIQSYTCLVVPNAITATGATPVYADIEPETLNLTPETVERVISNRTKAVICQHTFGIPADTERLRDLCDQYELPLIEDCAHIIPNVPLSPRPFDYRSGRPEALEGRERVRVRGTDIIGVYGDYLILSFGRDKAISGIAGGALITKTPKNVPQPMFAEPGSSFPLPAIRPPVQGPRTLQGLERRAHGREAGEGRVRGPSPQSSPNGRGGIWASEGYVATQAKWHIFRLILYPLLYFIARPLYGIGIGKLLLWLAAKLGLLVPIVTKEEKEGHMSTTLHAIPNACAALALTQFKKLQTINDHRRMLTKFYLQACKDRGWRVLEGITEDLPLQKFPMFIPSPLGGGLGRGGQRNSSTPSPCIPACRQAGSPQGRGNSADHLRSLLKRKNIHLSDGWTGCTICPSSAEGMAASILSLPTHPTMTPHQSQTLVEILEKFL